MIEYYSTLRRYITWLIIIFINFLLDCATRTSIGSAYQPITGYSSTTAVTPSRSIGRSALTQRTMAWRVGRSVCTSKQLRHHVVTTTQSQQSVKSVGCVPIRLLLKVNITCSGGHLQFCAFYCKSYILRWIYRLIYVYTVSDKNLLWYI